MDTINELFEDQIKDLYSAESQLLKALPKMAKKATSPDLKKGFEKHLKQTETHVERLGEIAKMWEFKPTGKKCKAMEGLIEEGKEILEEKSENEALIDAMLIGAARRVEHYEIAAYCTTRAMAKELGEDKIVKLLNETFDEESNADMNLSKILKEEILPEANTANVDEKKNLFALSAATKSKKQAGASKH